MHTKINQGHNSVNTLSGVILLVPGTSSDAALNFCKSISKGFRGVTKLNNNVDASAVANVVAGRTDRRTHARTNARTNGWKTGSFYGAMPEVGATKQFF